MKALGLVVSDKKIFENCILKTFFLTPWPTYATNWNGLNNFGRLTSQGSFLLSLVKIQWVVSEEKMFKLKSLRTTQDGRRTTDKDRSQ